MSALWSVLSTHTDTGSWHCGFEDFPFVFTASSWEGERKRKGKEEGVSRPRVCVGRPRESVPPNTQMAGKIHLLLTGSLADFYSVWVGERAGAVRRMKESRACKCTYVCTRKRERRACSELRGFYLHVQSDRAAQGRGAELWRCPSGTQIQKPNNPLLCPLLCRGTQEASSSWYPCKVCHRKISFSQDSLKWALKTAKTACLELNFLFIPWGDTAHTQVKVHILWLHAPNHEAVPLPTPLFHLNFWPWEEMNQWKSFKTTFPSSHISAKKQNQTMDWFFDLVSMKALLTCS